MKSKTAKTVQTGRRRVRAGILVKLLICTLIFLVVYLGYYQWFPTTFSNFLARFLPTDIIDLLRDWKYPIAVILYLFTCVLICVRTSTRYLKNLDMISESLLHLPEDDRAVPEFPEELSDVEMALKDAKYNIARSKQMSQEADLQKSELLTFLAHDLRTPLTSILGYLSLVRDNPEMPLEQRCKYMDITMNKAERLEQLLDEFFDITRMNTQNMDLDLKDVDLTMMLYQIADEFYPVFHDKDCEIVTSIEAGLKVQADPDKLARVFDNLLKNAAAYCYPDTDVEIWAERVPAPLSRSRQDKFQPVEEDHVKLVISNVGEAVSPEQLEMLFKKFYRSDSARSTRTGGAGLGLAIAREIVELHRGTIEAGAEGNRLSFTILLPAAEEK